MSKKDVVLTICGAAAGLVAARAVYYFVDDYIGTDNLLTKIGAASLAVGFFRLGSVFAADSLGKVADIFVPGAAAEDERTAEVENG